MGVKIGASHRKAPIIMPRRFLAEDRLRAVELVRAGESITSALHTWFRHDHIDRAEDCPGLTILRSAKLTKTKKDIRLPAAHVKVVKNAGKQVGEECLDSRMGSSTCSSIPISPEGLLSVLRREQSRKLSVRDRPSCS